MAHRTGSAALMHTASSAFVTGANHAVIAGVAAAAAGALIAVRTLRTAYVSR